MSVTVANAVEEVIAAIGPVIRLAIPLGLGKPNALTISSRAC